MKRLLKEIEELNILFHNNKIVLYGAGLVSRTVIKYASKLQFPLNGILVSYQEGNPKAIMGIPVTMIKYYKKTIQNEIIIVCTTEKIQDEIEVVLSNLLLENIFYISDELFGKLTYEIGNYDLAQFYGIESLHKEIRMQTQSLLRFIPRPCLEYMVLHILDHCNLRCQGCDHFACIADENFIPYETIHRDLERLSELFSGDYIVKMGVMGGEPLLHPDLNKILIDIRKYFPHTIIRLTTNGLLLLKQNEEFWRVCRENRIVIVNTKYPIHLMFNKIQEKAKSENVEFMFYEGSGGAIVKKSFKKVINLKGDSNPVESFAQCHISNYGNMLLDGKFYGCAFSCQSYRIFNKKFNQNLRITEDDYLDIYKVNDKNEFFQFAARPKYYCRYCKGLSPLFDWAQSKQVITEWLEE